MELNKLHALVHVICLSSALIALAVALILFVLNVAAKAASKSTQDWEDNDNWFYFHEPESVEPSTYHVKNSHVDNLVQDVLTGTAKMNAWEEKLVWGDGYSYEFRADDDTEKVLGRADIRKNLKDDTYYIGGIVDVVEYKNYSIQAMYFTILTFVEARANVFNNRLDVKTEEL